MSRSCLMRYEQPRYVHLTFLRAHQGATTEPTDKRRNQQRIHQIQKEG